MAIITRNPMPKNAQNRTSIMATPLAPPGAMNVRPRVSSRRIGIRLHYILIFRLPVGRTRYIRFFLIATRNAASLFRRRSSSVSRRSRGTGVGLPDRNHRGSGVRKFHDVPPVNVPRDVGVLPDSFSGLPRLDENVL